MLVYMASKIYSQRQAIKVSSLLFFLSFSRNSHSGFIVMNCKQLCSGQGLSNKSAFNKLSKVHHFRDSLGSLPRLLLYSSSVLRCYLYKSH